MARTTSSAVQDILANDYDSAISVSQFIDAATLIVDRVVACAIAKGNPLTTAEAEMVERYVAAHLYVQSDRIARAEKALDANIVYQGEWGMFITNSNYGQTAVVLDPSGCLSELSQKEKVVQINIGYKPPSEQIDYVDRD